MTECLKLNKSNCRNCYKCIRHCPVKSIRFSGNQAHIISSECILCGHCYAVCPQNAKKIVSEVEKTKVLMYSGAPVYASVAPSFAANYNTGIKEIEKALKKLGFAGAEETAIGATIVKREYERLVREEKRDVIITSCCHSVNLLIQKYFPAQLSCLADVLSPMQAHCMDIKKRYPDAKTVFIGPCIAKKDEAEHYEGIVDAVLTFDELSAWLKKENIEIEHAFDNDDHSLARIFPTSGGVLNTILEKNPEYTYMVVDGLDSCMEALQDIASGNVSKCFIEMSACHGSCIGGPVMEKRGVIENYKAVERYAGKEDFDVLQPSHQDLRKHFTFIDKKAAMPSENEILSILRKMGKIKPEDELNCGSCGYDTCRAKAAAIFNGKADISMCLPFLKDKAKSFSDSIVSSSPNGLIVLNDSLEVQQINTAALKMMNLKSASDVVGEPVIRVLDPTVFINVLNSHKDVRDHRVYLAEYKRFIEQTVVYDSESSLVICIMRDVTDEEAAKRKKDRISEQTVEIADKVVDKQMKIVQEIASLLGETAAETKIALTKLKEFIKDE
ncbi:MAG: 4Fe-4S binding protein [bacterium]|nr:4Fe-4S binding protein [bacterium]